MEKKQGFFSAPREEVVRGLSPARSRSKSLTRSQSPILLFRHRNQSMSCLPESFIERSSSLHSGGPDQDVAVAAHTSKEGCGKCMKWHLARTLSISAIGVGVGASSSHRRSDLHLLLGVMGAPLGSIHVTTADPLSYIGIKDTPKSQSPS